MPEGTPSTSKPKPSRSLYEARLFAAGCAALQGSIAADRDDERSVKNHVSLAIHVAEAFMARFEEARKEVR